MTLYNYCRVNKSRQERAASSGIVPPLVQLVQQNDPLKQFAIPILCDLAHTNRSTRNILWHHNIITVYLNLLRNQQNDYWHVNILDAIHAWYTIIMLVFIPLTLVCRIMDDGERVENVLLDLDNLELLIVVFVRARSQSLPNLIPAYHRLLSASDRLTKYIAKAAFMVKLVDRMEHPNVMVSFISVTVSVDLVDEIECTEDFDVNLARA